MLTQGETWLRPGVFIHSSMLEHWSGSSTPPPPVVSSLELCFYGEELSYTPICFPSNSIGWMNGNKHNLLSEGFVNLDLPTLSFDLSGSLSSTSTLDIKLCSEPLPLC